MGRLDPSAPSSVFHWDGLAWTQMRGGFPPMRYNHGLAVMGDSHSFVIFGGNYSTTVLSDTWVYDVCAADYNCDTFVDGIDSDNFNNDFENPDPQQQMNADMNRDGFVDGIDYDIFNNAFEAGC